MQIRPGAEHQLDVVQRRLRQQVRVLHQQRDAVVAGAGVGQGLEAPLKLGIRLPTVAAHLAQYGEQVERRPDREEPGPGEARIISGSMSRIIEWGIPER